MEKKEMEKWVDECNKCIDDFLKREGYSSVEEYERWSRFKDQRVYTPWGTHFGNKHLGFCLEH